MPFPNPDTQFKPGNRANPGGRPRGRSLTARLRDLLEKGEINGKPIRGGKQVADLVVETIAKHALAGDLGFMKLLVERADGRLSDVPDEAAGQSAIDPETAARVVEALSGEEGPEEEGPGE